MMACAATVTYGVLGGQSRTTRTTNDPGTIFRLRPAPFVAGFVSPLAASEEGAAVAAAR